MNSTSFQWVRYDYTKFNCYLLLLLVTVNFSASIESPWTNVNLTDVSAIRAALEDCQYFLMASKCRLQMPCDLLNKLSKVSGFTGDEAIALISKQHAIIFTDYENQDEMATISKGWQVITSYNYTHTLRRWVQQNNMSHCKIAYEMDRYTNAEIGFFTNDNFQLLISVGDAKFCNFSQIYPYPLEYSGQSWREKVASVRVAQKDILLNGTLLVSNPDDVAWLLNLRGSSLYFPYSPVFPSILALSNSEISLFVESSDNVSESVIDHLGSHQCETFDCVKINSVKELANIIRSKKQQRANWFTSKHSNYYATRLVRARSISDDGIWKMRSIKNPQELHGMRRSHQRNSVVINQIVHQIQRNMFKGQNVAAIEKRMESLLQKDPLYRGPSRPTLITFGRAKNGPDSSAEESYKLGSIQNEGPFTIQMGCQYLDGTTQFARTFHFGPPDSKLREIYTAVLGGLIDVLSTEFPEGTTDNSFGPLLATRLLHKYGLDCKLKIGFGIGHFLSYKEDQCRLDLRCNKQGLPLEAGQTLVVQVATHLRGKFAIKLSETVIVTNTNQTNGIRFLSFQTIGRVPFDHNLISVELLSSVQKEWLEKYNLQCKESLKGSSISDLAMSSIFPSNSRCLHIPSLLMAILISFNFAKSICHVF